MTPHVKMDELQRTMKFWQTSILTRGILSPGFICAVKKNSRQQMEEQDVSQ